MVASSTGHGGDHSDSEPRLGGPRHMSPAGYAVGLDLFDLVATKLRIANIDVVAGAT